MDLATKFQDTHPHAFFLDPDNQQELQTYLTYKGWIEKGSGIQSIEPIGNRTMNKVLRVTLVNGDTFIIKQSRPWVEELPDIPAPPERANIEAAYYQETSANDTVASLSPNLLHADSDSNLLMMEDLGEGSDLSYIYEPEATLEKDVLASLMEYVSELHFKFTQHLCDFYIENRGMRKLKAEHMFRFPFVEDNGLDLDEITPGLADVASQYRNNEELKEQIAFLQYRYLQNGETLLHGDYFPGSAIKTENSVKVIDPEYCFFGDAEFDLGVFHAHLMMAQQPEEIIEGIEELYEKPPTFSDMLYQQYTGMEIMRRLLGLEQLPLSLNLEEKQELLHKAYTLLLED